MSGDLAAAVAAVPDLRPWAPALVLSVEHAAARVTVSIDGSTPLSLRRIAAAYRPGDTVAVVRDPERSGSGQYVAGVLSSVAPRWCQGEVTAIDAPNSRLTVTAEGESVSLPHVAGTYSVGSIVVVMLDPASTLGGIVLGPFGNPPPAPVAPVAPVVPAAATLGTFEAMIFPTWSGTWSAKWGKWGAWTNGGRYGGPTSLYQGSAYGSGILTGLATYGSQVADLGATSITAMSAHVVVATGTGSPTLQGTATGTGGGGAPSGSGGTVAGAGDVDLVGSGIAESLRTGAAKGIVLVGSAYGAVFGKSRADGMALSLTYTKAI